MTEPHLDTELPSLKTLLELKKKYDAPSPGKLAESYKSNSDKEKLYIWSARNFESQIRHKYPTLKPHCLVCKNECDVEKLMPTFIKVQYPITLWKDFIQTGVINDSLGQSYNFYKKINVFFR